MWIMFLVMNSGEEERKGDSLLSLCPLLVSKAELDDEVVHEGADRHIAAIVAFQ